MNRLTRVTIEQFDYVVVAAADGRTVPADLVLVSIGITPETALVESAGLPCDEWYSRR